MRAPVLFSRGIGIKTRTVVRKGNNKETKEGIRMISFLGVCVGAALIGAIVFAINTI